MGYLFEIGDDRLDKVAAPYNKAWGVRLQAIFGGNPESATLSVMLGEIELGHVRLESVSGLSFVVSTDLYVDPRWRGNGVHCDVVELLDKAKFETVRGSYHSGIIAEVHGENAVELARMFKQGWQQVAYRNGKHLFVKTAI